MSEGSKRQTLFMPRPFQGIFAVSNGSTAHGIGRLRQGEGRTLFNSIGFDNICSRGFTYNVSQLGYSDSARVESAIEYDKSKEKEGYVAGKHIDGRVKWWFQKW